ncbi:uncharacterized protein [Ptychodera flava]|uniref:uncharacterized protein n=1 Tax=Ptychodera flava TaxID=63121 RepID=UPI00396A0B9F
MIKAQRWFAELSDLEKIRVQRCQQLPQEVVSVNLNTFVDSSQDAYGATDHFRSALNNAKSSSILVRQYECSVVDKEPKPEVQANRVGEIQTSTNPEQWRYIPTKENPADLVTRGVTAVDLADEDLWWKGPEFLGKPTSDWPQNPITKGNEFIDIEMKRDSSNRQVTFNSKKDPRISHCSIPREPEQQVQTAMVTTQTESTSYCLNPVRFSSWTTLKRIQAWVCRFLDNCKLPKEERTKGELLPEEIEEAEIMIIKTMQAESFPEEYSALVGKKELPKKSKLLRLRPRLDEDGLMRCDGRLRYADYYYMNPLSSHSTTEELGHQTNSQTLS